MSRIYSKLLNFISQSGSLMQMPRSHQSHLGNSFDNVASHSYQVAVIAYVIVGNEGLTQNQAEKCVTMAVFHDLVEARTSDFGFIAKQYIKVDEQKVLMDQLSELDFHKDLLNLFSEFETKDSQEAKIVKDADSLCQMYVEWVLMWQGNKLAQKWFESDFNDRYPSFFTQSARLLADEMKKSNPNEWWWSEFMENDAAKDKELLLGKRK